MYSIAIVVGALMVGASFLMDTSVSSGFGEVANLSKLQSQMMILHTGLALLIIGAIRMPKTTKAKSLHEGNSFAERDVMNDEERAARIARDQKILYVMLAALVVVAALFFLR